MSFRMSAFESLIFLYTALYIYIYIYLIMFVHGVICGYYNYYGAYCTNALSVYTLSELCFHSNNEDCFQVVISHCIVIV